MFSEQVHFEGDSPNVPGSAPTQEIGSGRSMSRREQSDRTEAAILTAAAQLFAQHGFEATTVRQVARRAGVSPGRVMSVGDKERLLVLTVESRVRRIHDTRASHGSGSQGFPPAEQTAGSEVRRLIRPFVEFFTSNERLARDYAAALARGRTEAGIFDELTERLQGEIGAVFATRGVASPAAAARTVYLAYVGALFTASHGALPFDRIEAEVSLAADLVSGDGGTADDGARMEGE